MSDLRVLILEDSPIDAELLIYNIRHAGYKISVERVDTRAAYLRAIDEIPQIILADYSLPQFNAMEALKLLQERALDIPFIVVSGTISDEDAVAFMKQGAADYLLKDRLGRLGKAIEHALEQKALRDRNRQSVIELQQAHKDLTDAYDETIEGWSRALDLRDKETELHTQRVTEITMRLAQAVGMDEETLVHVRRGALLHDIGKMGVPDHILLKPGPLTDEEWSIMRQHPVHAYRLLFPIEYLRPALDIPYSHHEKWDGTGYPRQLKADEIPLAARIFAIADVWDALSSDRPYRPACPESQVLEYIRGKSGTHFDPHLVEIFLKNYHAIVNHHDPP